MSSRWIRRSKNNKVIYQILNITENTKEKDCIVADKKNEKKYRETIEKLGNATKVWENTGVMLNMEVPPPPNPSNYESFLEYKRTHVLRPAIKQSEATIYLHERGYVLGKDYQAYQAIEVVKKLEAYEIEQENLRNPENTSYLKKIKNRRRSLKSDEDEIDLDLLQYSKSTEKKRHSINLPSFPKEQSKLPRKSASFYKTKRFKNKTPTPTPTIPSQFNTSPTNNNSSQSSVDSLFNEDELRQFEKNYERDDRRQTFTNNVDKFEFLSQQENYNRVYPPLDYLFRENCSV